MGSVALITLMSGAGILIVPLLERSQSLKTCVMVVMMGTAIGALLAEAFLHLIPHAIGHGTPLKHGDEHGFAHILEPNVINSLFVLLGVLLFFIADHAMSFFSLGCCHGDTHDSHAPKSVARRHCPDMADREPALLQPGLRGVLPIGWLILIGDALHNFMDGIAIGIGFVGTSGWTTALAVACHELPHELADFTILLMAGVPKFRAVLLNMASNLTSFVGAAIGILFHKSLASSHAKGYAMCFTAGGFVYIALADLVPALIKMERREDKSRDYVLLFVKLLSTVVGVVVITAALFLEDNTH